MVNFFFRILIFLSFLFLFYFLDSYIIAYKCIFIKRKLQEIHYFRYI